MEEWVITVMQSMGKWGTIGIMLLMAAENVFPPIPSEIVLSCAGFLTTCTALSKPQAIISATVGSMLGAVILYGFGRMLPLDRLEKIGFDRAEVEQASEWFNKKGRAAVLLCRCVPVVRSLISIPAGAARMRMTPFLLLTCIGTAVWDTALIYIGAAAGASWRLAAGSFHYKTAAALFVVFSFAITLLPLWWLKRKK